MSKDMLKGKINGLEKIRGYSAYEIAVMHGFDGTEEEWLDSLTDEVKQNAADAIASANQSIEQMKETATSAQAAIEATETEAKSNIEATGAAALTDIAEAKATMLSEIELAAEIVQTTGDSETQVMSQKAVSKELEKVTDDISDIERQISPLFEWVGGVSYTKVESTRWVFESATNVYQSAVSTGDAYEINIEGYGSVRLNCVFDTSALIIYKKTDGTYATIDGIERGVVQRDLVLEIPEDAVSLHLTFTRGYDHFNKIEVQKLKETIVHEKGDAEDKVMSQKAVTEELNLISDDVSAVEKKMSLLFEWVDDKSKYTITSGYRWVYISATNVYQSELSGALAYEVDVSGQTSVVLNCVLHSGALVIYKKSDGTYATIDGIERNVVLRDYLVELPLDAITLCLTFVTGYEHFNSIKFLTPVAENQTNEFSSPKINSAIPNPIFGSELAPTIENWTGDALANWDGSKWILSENGHIQTNINVTSGKSYKISLTVSNAVTPNAVQKPMTIALGGASIAIFGADDANWNVMLTAAATGSVSLVLGGAEWSGNISAVSVVEVVTFPEATAYLQEHRRLYCASTNVMLGSGQGKLAGGSENTGVGYNVHDALDTGKGNTAVGFAVQQRITNGSHNTGIGEGAQSYITTGMYNNGVGYASQRKLTSGCWNNAMGNESQRDITTGKNNVAMGRRAQNSITTGNENVAIGSQAGFYRDGGVNDTCATKTANGQVLIGFQATQSDSEQCDNLIAIGSRAHGKTNSVVLGANSSAPCSNSIAIGYGVDVLTDNTVRIGNDAVETIIFGNKKISFNPDGTVTWEYLEQI